MNVVLRSLAVASLIGTPLSGSSVQAQSLSNTSAGQTTAQAATITLSFQNADVAPVAAAVAKAVGKTIIVDPRVKGKVTLLTPQPVSPQTALDMFSSALRSASFALVQVNGSYRVIPDADARVQGNAVVTQDSPEGDQVVTRVFKIKQDSAANLVNVLRPLLTQNSSITANPGNNTLIVTDYASNVKRVAKLLDSMDEPSIGDVQAIHLRYAVAIDVASILTKMVENTAGGQPGGTDSKVVVIAEPRSNSILIKSSNPEKIRQLRSLVARLDAPSASNGNMWVVPLKNAEAGKLAVTLRAIVAADSSLSQQAGASNAGASSMSSPMSQPNMGAMQQAAQSGLVGGAAGGAAGANAAGGSSAAATGALTSTSQPNVGGLIQADTATNSLIITASESFYRNLREVIEKLDHRRTQVYVEALIVEIESTNSAQLGIQWQGLINAGGQNVPFGGTNYSTAKGVNVVDLSRNAASILNPALGGVPTLASANGMNIGMLSKFGGNYSVSALISAFDQEGGTRILSTPNLVTLDNEEARIMVGQNVPILAGSYTTNATSQTTPFQTYNRLDIGILLRVRPQISNNGTIKLTVYQEVSTVAPAAPSVVSSQGYTINKRTIESNVIVDDGQMFVIGGLIGDDYYDSSDGVPFLKDIPLIGALFRYDTKTRKKNNLMVFLRPYVIKDAKAAEEITTNRQDFIQDKQDSFKQLPMLLPNENLPTMDNAKTPLVNPGKLPPPAPTLRP